MSFLGGISVEEACDGVSELDAYILRVLLGVLFF